MYPEIAGRDFDLFERSRACLAPMAGYSDAPFRSICCAAGADFCVTEMVSSEGLVRGGDRTLKMTGRIEGEGPLGIQLFGSKPAVLAEAAGAVAGKGFEFIDLNFGCPVKKVIKKNGGSAIMRDLSLMERICGAVVESSSLPVTVKIRSGWNREEENFIEAGKIAEDSGVSAVIMHPRYRSQGFSGKADWGQIARLRDSVSIPVVANGDVNNVDDYLEIVGTTGCELVMIGRGALGHPWIFRDIKDRLAGKEPGKVSMQERVDTLQRLFRMEISWKGKRLGLLEMRKFYRWFLRGSSGMREYRRRLAVASDVAEVDVIFADLREEIGSKWKRTG